MTRHWGNERVDSAIYTASRHFWRVEDGPYRNGDVIVLWLDLLTKPKETLTDAEVETSQKTLYAGVGGCGGQLGCVGDGRSEGERWRDAFHCLENETQPWVVDQGVPYGTDTSNSQEWGDLNWILNGLVVFEKNSTNFILALIDPLYACFAWNSRRRCRHF